MTNFSTERIIGLQKVLEDNNVNVRIAAEANEEEVLMLLMKIMTEIEMLIKRTPNLSDAEVDAAVLKFLHTSHTNEDSSS